MYLTRLYSYENTRMSFLIHFVNAYFHHSSIVERIMSMGAVPLKNEGPYITIKLVLNDT